MTSSDSKPTWMPTSQPQSNGVRVMSYKLTAGASFPAISALNDAAELEEISKPAGKADWRMLVVYRGRHCPLCTKYLNALEGYVVRLSAIGVDLAVVSGDSQEQLAEHQTKLEVSYPIHHGLTIDSMKELGLYISHPRSEQETDHPFAEPGLFVINEQGQLQVVDISNNPFVRPELDALVSGLEWIRSHNYPIRGTFNE